MCKLMITALTTITSRHIASRALSCISLGGELSSHPLDKVHAIFEYHHKMKQLSTYYLKLANNRLRRIYLIIG